MPEGTRRLAAIMFTDLAGFTRLGQRDEEAALALRREHQALVRPLFVAHGGREVKTLGDGFLVEFPSAVESVRCAVAIQEAVDSRNALPGIPEPIRLRIGIHVGDVIGEGSDIVGDAVNVASRIEPLAEPGSVYVSSSVFDQVRNKVKFDLERLGPRELKNVDDPIEIYRVEFRGGARGRALPPAERDPNLRLAVLPFSNLSPDSSDAYFADGLTEELIGQVSRIPNVRVIARTSILRYRGSSKSIREVGQELGVRLALEGSVRKAGDRLRINVQLIDTRSEEHLWSQRYDRPFTDIFVVQDEIAGQVAGSIAGHLSGRRSATAVPLVQSEPDTADLGAYSSFLHGRKLLDERSSEATMREAAALFESAIARDPGFARARVGLAEALLWLGVEGAMPHLDSNRRAQEELERAIARNDALAEAHSALAGLLVGADEPSRALREARRAIELNPSLSDAYRWIAQLEASGGRIDETIRLLEEAQRLNPVDVNITSFLGRAYWYGGREEDALAHWKRTQSIAPYRTRAHFEEYQLAKGDLEGAATTLEDLERIRPKSVWTLLYRGYLAALKGDRARANAALGELDRRAEAGELTGMHAGFLHFALGEDDAFVDRMEEAFRLHNFPMLELLYSPLYAGARRNPRILDLIRRQRELGEPISGRSP